MVTQIHGAEEYGDIAIGTGLVRVVTTIGAKISRGRIEAVGGWAVAIEVDVSARAHSDVVERHVRGRDADGSCQNGTRIGHSEIACEEDDRINVFTENDAVKKSVIFPIVSSMVNVTVPNLSTMLTRTIRVATTNVPLYNVAMGARTNIDLN